jgi:hypothetical protein
MKYLLSASIAVILSFVCGAHARAAIEFCPAQIAQVSSISGQSNAYAVRLTALSPRSVTGQLLFETDRGWYRAPFTPIRLEKPGRVVESQFIEVVLPPQAVLKNVWLSQAASDDAQWGPHGIVTCPPEPHRLIPTAQVDRSASVAANVMAMPMDPPLSYACAKPFSEPHLERDVMDNDQMYDPGDFAVARVHLDAAGKVIDVTGIDASGGDFNLRKELEQRVMHMRFSPGMAYCKPVPSTNILRESAP